ncbi:MAG: hypothetical protein DDG60_11055 [Anaerolineae bacterium]|nr:MAG: hypothetical protein DDG60_11055 [Anaerolineae bacterium]
MLNFGLECRSIQDFRKNFMEQSRGHQKWYVLFLVILTNLFVVAMPMMGVSVLSKEISQELGLSVVQIGAVWGAGALPGIPLSLLAGTLGDKFGTKRVLVLGSLLAGLLGAARGLATDFVSLTVLVILVGALLPFVSMTGIKAAGQWFPSQQLGLANGLISMGMALGFLLGALLSATTFSPWLGGWRNVLFAYGLIGASFSLPWYFAPTLPSGAMPQVSMHRALRQVLGVKNVWLLGLTLFGVGGCIQGLLGYLPLYLRNQGWNALRADGALSAFHTVSMLCVLPIALWSDRLGARKRLVLIAIALIAFGTGWMSVANDAWVWVAVSMAGMVRDAFMALFMTMVIETKGVGPAYAGTALGLTMALGGLGNFLAPPLGNSLAAWWPAAPFLFWAMLAILGMACFRMVQAEI